MIRNQKTISRLMLWAAALLALIGVFLLIGAIGSRYSQEEAVPYGEWTPGKSGALRASILLDASEQNSKFYFAVNDESDTPLTLVRMTKKQTAEHASLYLVTSDEEKTTETLYGKVKEYSASVRSVAYGGLVNILGNVPMTESDLDSFIGSYYLDCTVRSFLAPILLLGVAALLGCASLVLVRLPRKESHPRETVQ